MRIKRFIAPDMRTALRMVRTEQGPDAVILSNRVTPDGIEVVAATDYDEALVGQALRASAPYLEVISAPAEASQSSGEAHTFAAQLAGTSTSNRRPALTAVPAAAPAERSAATNATNTRNTGPATKPASTPRAARDGFAARARAVFRIGDGPTLAELTATVPAPTAGIPSPALATEDDAPKTEETLGARPQTRLEAMMVAMGAPPPHTDLPTATAVATNAAAPEPVTVPLTFADAISAATFEPDAWDGIANDCHVTLSTVAKAVAAPAAIHTAHRVDVDAVAHAEIVTSIHRQSPLANAPPLLRAVADVVAVATDPAMLAMREELTSMRQLIERQMEQLSVERLCGSPARAAAYQALLAYGCDDALAQAIAAKLDPRLPLADFQAPMLAELARMLTIAPQEPLEDGGVIALVGPTGAGKTTTAAKLAARFAARHRARDVALVTTDSERAGAHEQLHAHGRRLGITVCEATGPEGLTDALAQLADYPLVLVDTTGYAPRDRANFSQILWLRSARKVRSLLVLPANAHPHHLGEVIRRYRPASPEGVVLTKLDETGCLGSALSVSVSHGLTLAYTTHGQQVPADIDLADATRLAGTLEKLHRAADNSLATEDRHVSA